MLRVLGFFGFVVVLALSAYLFEWQHVWPFNADRVGLLRLLFYASLAGAVLSLLFSSHRWLPPLFLTLGFGLTTVLSKAQFDTRGLVIAGVFLVGAWLSAIVVGPPLAHRRR